MTSPDLENNLISAINTFAFRVFGQVSKRVGDRNIFISPLSLTYALVLLHLGACEITQQELAQVLGIQNIELNKANAAYANLQRYLTQYGEQEALLIANSLWIKQEMLLNSNFIQSSKDLFAAEVSSIDFAVSDAAEIINNWVSRKTNQKINEIITPESLNSDTILILLNAIYFKGRWKNSFAKTATMKADFTLANGQSKPVAIMSQSREYEYFQDDNCQAIIIPYEDDNASMIIFLPDEQISLSAFHNRLDLHSWQQWQAQFSPTRVYLGLPSFKIEYGDSLMEDLRMLGLGTALSHSANYQNICNERIAVSDIKHKACMEVNEEGTEAAAATSVLMQRIVGGITRMIINRPFFCAIKHNQTGVFLFMGAIWEPS